MGNSSSSTVRQTIDAVNQNMLNIFTSQSNSANVTVTSNQNFTLIVQNGAVIDCGDGSLNVTQTNQVTVDFTATFNSSNSTNLSNQIQAAIDAASESQNSQVSGFLNTAIANDANSTTDVKTSIKNLISQNIQNIASNACMATASIVQNQQVIFDNARIISNGCNFGQNVQAYVALNCITSQVVDLINENTSLSSQISKAISTNEQSNRGFFESLGAFFGSITGILVIFGVIAAIVLVIFLSQKKNNGGQQQQQPYYGQQQYYPQQQQPYYPQQSPYSYYPQQQSPSYYPQPQSSYYPQAFSPFSYPQQQQFSQFYTPYYYQPQYSPQQFYQQLPSYQPFYMNSQAGVASGATMPPAA